ncbi:PEP-utilizing enzyme [Streptomyces sp. NPDC002537]
MTAHVSVVLPRPLRGREAWTNPARLSGVVAQVLDQPPLSLDLTTTPPPVQDVLTRENLSAALWLPHAAVPTEACRCVVWRDHGVGVWTGEGPLLPGYSFGRQALEAYTRCTASGCRRGALSVAEAARHLIQYHRVPLTGPRKGLAPWSDGEQRARLLLRGKDVSLRRLAVLLPSVRVDPGLSVTWQAWESSPRRALAAIAARYPEQPVIVRSCSSSEDGWDQSRAGAFASVPVPPPTPPEAIAQAAQEVFASYGEQHGPDARVLVQQWLHPVQAASVVTTRTLLGAPYYTATVDTDSGRTDAVTAGTGQGLQTWYVRRRLAGPGHGAARLPSVVAHLLGAAVETERCAGTSRLDVEVALVDGTAHLLQARPLAAARVVDDMAVHAVVDNARRQVVRIGRRPSVLPRGGAEVVLSNMADWNPAEMLGRRPSALAASLYRELLTDRTWAVQRAAYGCRDLRGTPLMHVVAGAPYVDATASLASFLPAGLDEALAVAVLRAMVERLVADPSAHDKIEFEIAATCWTPSVTMRTAYLAEAGIGTAARARLHDQLLALTRHGVQRLPADLATLDGTGAPTPADTQPQRLATTIATARTAAVRFAHLARAAFVATDLLRALEADGLADRREAWMRGLGTVTTVLRRDAAATAAGRLSWAEFVTRYRWLRPGTYDLTVPTYGDDPDGYLRPLLTRASTAPGEAVAAPWSERHAAAVDRAVAPLGLDVQELEAFCRAAVTGRERGKALYAAWVSGVLEAVAARAAACGVGRGDAQHLRIGEVLAVQPGRWPHLIARRRARADVCALIELPDVITRADDLDSFARGRNRANFVTTGRASGPVAADPAPAYAPPPGAVIVLEAADPGYDWVFAYQPVALVTAYGGANSHMAIRCAELGIPAAIGIGSAAHAVCAAARHLAVDAAAGRVDVLP